MPTLSGGVAPASATLPVLAAVGLYKAFGSLVVIEDVTVMLERGCRLGVIGPNGAGKTTLLNLLSGALKPDRGAVLLDGDDVSRLSVDARARRGLARSFQANHLFGALTVRENLEIACILKHRWQRPCGGGLWRTLTADRAVQRAVDASADALHLTAVLGHPVATLPYGVQRQLEIGLALSMESSVLLLDEPTAGMSAAETEAISALIQALPATLTVLVIEHDMEVLFNIAERVVVLDYGRVIMDADVATARASPTLQQRYLGIKG